MLLTAGMIASLAACGTVERAGSSTQEQPSETAVESAQIDTAESSSSNKADTEQTEIELSFGDTVMTAALDDSETSRAFIKMLPLTLTMNRYADREYYAVNCRKTELPLMILKMEM